MKMPFKHGERVLCVKESPDRMLDGSISDNGRCTINNVYTVDLMVWTSKAGWLIGHNVCDGCMEFHSAQDFVSSGYPRYFVGKYWSDRDAYLRFDSGYECTWVKDTGEEVPQSKGAEWDADKPDLSWKEVTEVEAKSRLKSTKKVETVKTVEKTEFRWVENCRPDKPGIWAVKRDDFEHVYLVDRGDLYSLGTWCYLGPMPEILPPVKKVVERLWIKHITHITGTDAQYRERWIQEGHTCTSDWIKTDRTREAI